MPKTTNRLLICGGGSGGHLFPSIAIAQNLRKINPNLEILFVVSDASLDKEIMRNSGFDFQVMKAGKWRRYFSWQNFMDIYHIIISFVKAGVILRKFKPNLVFTKGGFVALPVALMAKILKIPIITHESDTITGIANRLIGKLAQKICYAFPTEGDAKNIYTGIPIRREILEADAKKAKIFLDFTEDKPLIVFTGGSQGAKQLNDICSILFKNNNWHKEIIKYNFVLVCGQGKKTGIVSNNFREFEFLGNDWPHILKLSDIVVSRSGANAITELAALCKTTILIPLQSSANNHQVHNAKNFANKKAAVYLDSNLSTNELTEAFVNILKRWEENPDEKLLYADNIQKMVNLDAVDKISQIIFENLKKSF